MKNKKLPLEAYGFDQFILDDSFINFVLNKEQVDVLKWEKWLAQNPKNKAIATEAKKAILTFRFKKQALSDDFVFAEWHKLNNRLHLNKAITPLHNRKILRKKIGQYAAVASILLLLAGAIYYYTSSHKQQGVLYSQEVEVPKGKINKIILPDSTLVYINADSKLKYSNFSGKQKREVFLEGEAYFDVTHNAKKPFIVHTAENDITVHGTAFDVYAYPDENIFRTSLECGKIAVSHNKGKAVYLKVKQTYLFNKESKQSSVIETPNGTSCSAWKDGIIAFRNQRFADMLRTLSRTCNVTFELRNKKVGNIRFTGSFSSSDNIDAILGVVKTTTPFDFEKFQDTIIIK